MPSTGFLNICIEHMLAEAKLKRIVTSPMPWSEITTMIVAFRAGSRGEPKGLRGIAHFAEHMLFKGTEKYPLAKDINEAVAELGGYVNATTNVEYTYYVMQVANHSAGRAIQILADMTLHPRLPDKEFDIERPVVIDEMIQSHHDDIGRCEILFEDLMYEHQPLGWDISGTIKSLKGIRRGDVAAWLKAWYVGRTCSVIMCGGADMRSLAKVASRAFAGLPAGRPPAWKPFRRHANNEPIARHLSRKVPLTTMMVGYPAPDFGSRRAESLRMLNIVLGVNQSSRLYDRIREKEGLTYEISSMTEMYGDAGHILAATQVQPEHVDAALRGILEEFKRLNAEPVSMKEFRAAKELRLAHLKALMEDQETLVKHYMKDLFMMKRIRPVKSIIKETESVTLEDVRLTAKRVFRPERWYMASIGRRKPRIPPGL